MVPLSLINFLILSLAVWRISSLLVKEAGPWRVFVWLRERAGITHDADWNPWIIPDRFFAAQLLGCIWCTSLWAGVVGCICLIVIPDITIWLALPFSLSTVAIVLDKHIRS